MPEVRRRAAPRGPEVFFLFLLLRPRDTGDIRTMVGPAVTAVADTWIEIGLFRATEICAVRRLVGHASCPSDTERVPAGRGTQGQARCPIMPSDGVLPARAEWSDHGEAFEGGMISCDSA
jgi:hypothetical protein